MTNMTKTFMLMAGLTALVCGLGYALAGPQGMVMAFGIAALMNVGSWWFSDKMVLRMYGAREVTAGAVYDMTRELAMRAEMPMPKVYVMETPQPNAFATGRSPEKGAVAVTTGIMQILDARELRGVIAHELAHIKNRDTLTMTITATMAGALSMLANFMMFFGGGRERPNPLVMILVMIVAPLAASLVQMSISRVREYAADRDGALIADDPLALASALQKIERAAMQVDNHVAEQNPATAHMFIINPLHAHAVDGLFSTHPKTANRVAELHKMAGSTLPASDVPRSKNPWRFSRR